MTAKLSLYVRSACAQRGPNWRGFPLLPKRLVPHAPRNRAAFNEFVLWIRSLRLPNVRQVVDVGANHGDFSQAVAALYTETEVLLVEPLPHLRARLDQLCQSRGRSWQVADCALGSSPGAATLHIDPRDDAIGSLLGFSEAYRAVNPHVDRQRSIECKVTTLDDLCEGKRIETIDLLKVDVEGFEFEVLKGGSRMLRKTQAIVLELSLVRRGGAVEDGLAEMVSILRKHEFAIVALIPSLFAAGEPWKPVEFNILARR